MNTTIKYYGYIANFEPANVVGVNDFKDHMIDVVFDELISNEKFIREADQARTNLIRNPQKFPSISSKYRNILSK